MTTETTETAEKFIIILMILCFAVVSFVSVVSKKNLTKRETQISCEKGSDLALTRKLADGTYYAYFPFASLTEESKMTPYREKYFLSEGRRVLHSAKKATMGST